MSFSAVPTESERPSGEVITSEAIGYEAIRGGNHEQSHHEAINFKNEVNIKNEIASGVQPGQGRWQRNRCSGRRQRNRYSGPSAQAQGCWFNIETLFCVKYQVLRHQNRC